MWRRIAYAGGVVTCFSFHPLLGKRANGSALTNYPLFPQLPANELPAPLRSAEGLINLAAITVPTAIGTYFWSGLRATGSGFVKPKGIGGVVAIVGLMSFDIGSWVRRLQVYGVQNAYYLSEENKPATITRPKSEREILTYRCNQVLLPSLLVVGGQWSGVCPQLLLPILTWKAFWHFYLIYQNLEVQKQLGVTPGAAFRELEEQEGREIALQYFCDWKHLSVSAHSEALYLSETQS